MKTDFELCFKKDFYDGDLLVFKKGYYYGAKVVSMNMIKMECCGRYYNFYNTGVGFHLLQIKDYFYTRQELRKNKLNKLQQSSDID